MRYPAFRSLANCLILAAALAAKAGAQTSVTVDVTKTVRVVDDRTFGTNTPFWDSTFTSVTSLDSLQEMNTRFMRFGGGSATDEYNWATNQDEVRAVTWAFNVDAFAVQAKAVGAQAIITTNYGSGTPAEAAAYVQYANITQGYGFKYWEIGNECYGTWEHDINTPVHDAFEYATRAVEYINAMKAVDPTIKVGVVADANEDSYQNGTTHSAVNPVTGVSHSGWTPIMLSTMKTNGVFPDFLIYHSYNQGTGQENDAMLLQESAVVWSTAAAELRMQLTDYLGHAAGDPIELLVTENNSVSTNPGKQSVSLVNGLFLADSTANLMQTEFNSLIWWDFHNGQGFNTAQNPINLSSSLYGWRQYGDYGVENLPTNDRYPTFYVSKLLSHFARGGDTVVTASSSSTLLSAYAVKRAGGSLSILVINKSPTATTTANFTLTGYSPQASATVYSFGIPQDTAAQTGSGSHDLAVSSLSGVGATFSASFGPYSASVISLIATGAPSIQTPPADQYATAGGSATFSATASGSSALSYQWNLNGAPIAGATGSSYTVTNALAANAGPYTVTVTDSAGSTTSDPATLYVSSSSPVARLINISTRAQVGTGANMLIPGFVIGVSGTETLLIRADGPALTSFGVGGVLAQPSLSVIDQASTTIASNIGWGTNMSTTPAQIASIAAQVGAFALTANSADCALVITLGPGAYTVQVSGVGGTTGVALAEVYEVTHTGTARLINISTRAQVGTGASLLIPGFVISGAGNEQLLVRGDGPALTSFGVGGVLAQPSLSVINQASTTIASNTGWGNALIPRQTASAASFVGAFPLTANSADSAQVVTFNPGAYTMQISGVSGTTGVALAEVYEVP